MCPSSSGSGDKTQRFSSYPKPPEGRSPAPEGRGLHRLITNQSLPESISVTVGKDLHRHERPGAVKPKEIMRPSQRGPCRQATPGHSCGEPLSRPGCYDHPVERTQCKEAKVCPGRKKTKTIEEPLVTTSGRARETHLQALCGGQHPFSAAGHRDSFQLPRLDRRNFF
jgi:hypothetical protein